MRTARTRTREAVTRIHPRFETRRWRVRVGVTAAWLASGMMWRVTASPVMPPREEQAQHWSTPPPAGGTVSTHPPIHPTSNQVRETGRWTRLEESCRSLVDLGQGAEKIRSIYVRKIIRSDVTIINKQLFAVTAITTLVLWLVKTPTQRCWPGQPACEYQQSAKFFARTPYDTVEMTKTHVTARTKNVFWAGDDNRN